MDSRFRDDMTLREARDLLRTMVEDGATCPCCKQRAQIYKRTITSAMARALIRVYRHDREGWVFIPDLLTGQWGGDYAKLRYWGLVEEQQGTRDDGSDRVGWWRLTELGRAYVERRATVPRHARVYDKRLLGLAGEHVGIERALGKRFRYDELMAGTG